MENPSGMVSNSARRSAALAGLFFAVAALGGSAAPMISEFLADNETGLRDEDAEFSDWLELYNPDPDPIDLSGYFLTDNPTNLNKWEIPATTILPAGGFLVVFASDKDRAVAGSQLHTNFKLDDAGEYLALVAPDGVTVVSEYAPAYPPQFDDATYGYEQIPMTVDDHLVDVDDPCTALVPASGVLGNTWTVPGFDDSGWTAGTLGVGYDRGSEYEDVLNLNVESGMYAQNASVYVRIPFTVDNVQEILGLDLEMQYDDGFSVFLNGFQVAGANAPVTTDWSSSATQEHPDADALEFETFSLDAHLHRLQEGENVLAIHGLNVAAGDDDMLIRPRLIAARLVSLTTGPLAYFAVPTPGSPNGLQQALPTSEVRFSVKSKMFTEPFDVTLSSEFPDETIRYTLNGAVPGPTATEYTGPIAITNSTQLRARVYSSTNVPGAVTMESYLRIDPTLANFSSNLPIVIIDTWGRGTPNGVSQIDGFWAIIAPDPVTGRASMTDPLQVGTRCGLKRRGSSSFGWPKYSMTVEAQNEEGDDKGVNPLDFPRESDWVLSGRYQFDRALMRNPLIYRLSNETGEYAVRTRFVEVLNNTNGGNLSYNGDYFGVYTLMEKIKGDDDRVDIASLDRRDNREPAVTGGYIFKKDRLDNDEGEVGFQVNGMGTLAWVEPNEREVTTAQSAWLRGHLNEFDAALNRPDWTHPSTRKHFTEYLDQDSWLRHHWLNTIAMNVDGFRLSGYYYKNRIDKNDGRIGAGPIWDFDRSMGSTDSRDDNPRQWDGTGDSSRTWSDGRYPWWGRALTNPDFRQAHTDLWQELRKTVFSIDNIYDIINEFAAEIDARDPADANPGFPANRRTPAARNFARWPENPPSGGSYFNEIRNLQTWLRSRVTWIDSQYTQQPGFTVEPGLVDAGTEVSFTMQSGATVYYTTDGSDPRISGGDPSSSAIATNASSPVPAMIDQTAVITARARIGTGLTSWSGPVQGTFLVGPIANATNLAVTEVHYAPRVAETAAELASSTDASDFEFIELRNISAVDTIDLTGVHFVNGIEFTFTGAAITSLAPGERVLVVCNQAAFEARYGVAHSHRIAGQFAPTRLDNAGERLHLVDGLGNTIANFRYNDKTPWPPDAGFAGYSMVLNTFAMTGPDYEDPASWRSSVALDGNPNGSDSHPLVGEPLEDGDGDGLEKILEHALGTSDDDPADAANAFSASIRSIEVAGVASEFLTITFRRSLAADDVRLVPELSYDLVDWASGGHILLLAEEANQGDGTAVATYRTAEPVDPSENPHILLRLRATRQ